MGRRGRKSSASLSVVSPGHKRPDPPDELTEQEREEWVKIVERMPADWFPLETHPMLVQLCRHIVIARLVAQSITNMQNNGTFDMTDWDRLLRRQDQESKIICDLSTKMRLTQSSRYDKKKTSGPKGTKKPWET